MADATIANTPAETSVTGGNGDDPVDVMWRNVQHLLCQAEKDWQTIKMHQRQCDQLETRLEAALRRHHSDEDKIQELQGKLEEFQEKMAKMKSQAEPPRPSLSAKAQGDKNVRLEVRDGKREDTETDQEAANWTMLRRERDTQKRSQ